MKNEKFDPDTWEGRKHPERVLCHECYYNLFIKGEWKFKLCPRCIKDL